MLKYKLYNTQSSITRKPANYRRPPAAQSYNAARIGRIDWCSRKGFELGSAVAMIPHDLLTHTHTQVYCVL